MFVGGGGILANVPQNNISNVFTKCEVQGAVTYYI